MLHLCSGQRGGDNEDEIQFSQQGDWQAEEGKYQPFRSSSVFSIERLHDVFLAIFSHRREYCWPVQGSIAK